MSHDPCAAEYPSYPVCDPEQDRSKLSSGGGQGGTNNCQLAYEHNTALMSRFDTEKDYGHDTATYMFLLLKIPPILFWQDIIQLSF